MSHIFISYSRKDIEFASQIVQALAQNKLDTWIDWKSIPKGEDWKQEIYRGIEEADAFLFLISPDSVISAPCNEEIVHALNNNKRVIPIVLRDAKPKFFPDETAKDEIARRNWIFCREGRDDFQNAIAETVATIRTDYVWLKYHTRLQVKALEWERIKDPGRLLRGRELQEAEQKLADISSEKDPQPTSLQRQFVLQSRRHEDRQRRQAVIGLVVGLIIVAVSAIVTWQQKNLAVAETNAKATALVRESAALDTALQESNARATAQAQAEERTKIALAEKLAVQSLALQETNFSTSMLLGIEAYQKYETPRTRGLLLNHLQINPQLQAYLTGHTERVNDVAYSPDGKMIASASDDHSIILWDAATQTPIGKPLIGHKNWVSSISFSPDGKLLASASVDTDIILWDVSAQVPIGQLLQDHDYGVSSVLFSPDGKTLASVVCSEIDHTCVQDQIILWDAASLQPLGEPLTITSGSINCIEFSPDGRILALCNDQHDIILWDLESSTIVGQLSTHFSLSSLDRIASVTFSPDGQVLASGFGNTVLLLSVPDLQPASELFNGHTGYVTSLDFSPDGKTLASGSYDQTIILWDIATEQPVGRPLTGHTREVTRVAYSPNGNRLASGSGDGNVIIWNVETQDSVLRRSAGSPVYDVAYSPDGKLLASVGDDNTIDLWDAASPDPIAQIPLENALNITSLAFSPDGTILAVATCTEMRVQVLYDLTEIILLDVASGTMIGQPLVDHRQIIESLAFSPDGNLLASGSNDNSIVLWDVKKHKFFKRLSMHSDRVSSVAFSPDGKTLASGSYDDTVILWDTASFNPMGPPLKMHTSWVTSVTFSPDGKTLASAGWDGAIIFWDVTKQSHTGHPMVDFDWINVTDIAFSPDGRFLASGRSDQTILLWDVENRQTIGLPLKGHTHFVNRISFRPDGKMLASGGEDGFIAIWDLDPLSWIESICQRAGRNLTQAEWAQYFTDEPYRMTCPQWSAGQ